MRLSLLINLWWYVSFNSRTPGGVRHNDRSTFAHLCYVSIHAPREGCDSEVSSAEKERILFQFTHPGRGATYTPIAISCRSLVSIHAPREGCDQKYQYQSPNLQGFNSRTPGGVRQSSRETHATDTPFQFTHPGRGATSPGSWADWSGLCFNSRTPGGVRRLIDNIRSAAECFNSRTPGGVRHQHQPNFSAPGKFQFTHPGRGATGETRSAEGLIPVSIHAPREGCDPFS